MLRSLRPLARLGSKRLCRTLQHGPLVHSTKGDIFQKIDHSIHERMEKAKAALREGKFEDHGQTISTARPIMFTVLFVTTGFVAAAVVTNYETEKYQKRTVFDLNPKINVRLSWMGISYSLQMYNQWWRDCVLRAIRIEDFWGNMGGQISAELRDEAKLISSAFNVWWLRLLEGQQICRQIALCFVAIHFMRYSPITSSFASRYFTHNITSGRVLTLLTGQLGHSNWLHLGSNVIRLMTAGELTWFILRNKQVEGEDRLHEALSGYHFLAFYAAAGTVASLTSHLFLTRMQLPKLINALAKHKTQGGSEAAVQQVVHTAGSSGAVSASMTICALEWLSPDASFLYFPVTDMKMGPILFTFAIADAIGLRRGWRRMDYAAHLGGGLFGAAYCYLGPSTWDWLRRMTEFRRPLWVDWLQQPKMINLVG